MVGTFALDRVSVAVYAGRGGETPAHQSRPTCLQQDNLVLLPHLFYSRYYGGG